MGGIISQVLSCRNEGRVLSLTSIMSTSGSGPVRPRATLKLAGLCAPRSSKEGYRRAWMHVVEFINEAPIRMEEEEIRKFVDYVLSCDYRPSAAKRQLLAALRSGDRTEQLRQIRTPTLVLHGTHDHLLPKEHAVSTARFIPNAKLEMLEGMGHNLPDKLGERLGCIVSDHVFDSTA